MSLNNSQPSMDDVIGALTLKNTSPRLTLDALIASYNRTQILIPIDFPVNFAKGTYFLII